MITPSGLHFERHHSGVPDIDPDKHRLLIHGMVKRPLIFSVDALSRYPMVSRIHFLECSGNSQILYQPTPPTLTAGQTHGLVSCSEWINALIDWRLISLACSRAAAVDQSGKSPMNRCRRRPSNVSSIVKLLRPNARTWMPKPITSSSMKIGDLRPSILVVLSPNGSTWIACRPNYFLTVEVLSALFRRLFLEMLFAAHDAGRLQFFGDHGRLADKAAFKAYLRPLREIDWVVYAKEPFAGPRQVLHYLSRYTHRIAISNRRLVSADENGVAFTYKDYRLGVPPATRP